MRNMIRSCACAFLLMAAMAVPVTAATTGGDNPDDLLTKLKNAIIVIYEEAKIIIPTT